VYVYLACIYTHDIIAYIYIPISYHIHKPRSYHHMQIPYSHMYGHIKIQTCTYASVRKHTHKHIPLYMHIYDLASPPCMHPAECLPCLSIQYTYSSIYAGRQTHSAASLAHASARTRRGSSRGHTRRLRLLPSPLSAASAPTPHIIEIFP
jgi:hypothetical protein